MKQTLFTFLTLGIISSSVLAGDIVYVTARTSPTGSINTDGTYTEVNLTLGDTSAVASGPGGRPPTGGARYYASSTFLTDTTAGINLTPTLGVPGGVYQIHHNFSSTAGNVTTNVILSAACSSGGVLSFASTDKFQRQYGNPANQWQFLGYLTNDVGSATPTIEFRYQSGDVSSAGSPASTQSRLLFDCWRFTEVEPCLFVPVVGVTGPVGANSTTVTVTGVTNVATKITVYQDSGAGMVQVGSSTTGIVNSNNTVPVSGLVKGAQVVATQTVGGQEGCVAKSGVFVGGGANPRIRVALSIRETPSAGPVGAPGATTDADIHFLGATTRISGAPGDGPVLYPNSGWQTLTFSADRQFVGNASNVVGTASDASAGGYNPNDSLTVQVYAYRTVPANGTTIYSRVGALSPSVTSNNFFAVNWSWQAVAGAEGYRLLRNVNSAGYNEATDVVGANSFADANNAWYFPTTVTPTNSQLGASVKWNSAGGSSSVVGTQNDLATQWGILEAIAFAIDDVEDTGPYDLWIDNIQNGSTVFQTFEDAPAGTTDYAFRVPIFSGTTSGNLLASPNVGMVSSGVADSGTKAFHVQFQWNGTNASKWLRLTTSGVNNPQVNLDEPISVRFLMQPVGATLPAAPQPPLLSVAQIDGQQVLSWVGGHRVQTAVDVMGEYTNVSQVLSANTWTNITMGAYLAPWTNTFPEPTRFFRLVD